MTTSVFGAPTAAFVSYNRHGDGIAHSTNGAMTGCYKPVDAAGMTTAADARKRELHWCQVCWPARCPVCDWPAQAGSECPACLKAALNVDTDHRRAAA